MTTALMGGVREKHFTITLRIAGGERSLSVASKAYADGRMLDGRKIRLANSPVAGCDFKGEGALTRGDEVEILIHELNSTQEILGSFDFFSFIEFSLPTETFEQFWTASATADGTGRNIAIHFKNDETQFFRITRVVLTEYLPTLDNDDDPKKLTSRPHPVVAELRDMKRQVLNSLHGWLIFLGFAFGIGIVIEVVRTVWHWVQP
jgi:hypothetical protein